MLTVEVSTKKRSRSFNENWSFEERVEMVLREQGGTLWGRSLE